MSEKQQKNELKPVVSFNDLVKAFEDKTPDELTEMLHHYKDGLVRQLREEQNSDEFITIPRLEFAFLINEAGRKKLIEFSQAKLGVFMPPEALELSIRNSLEIYVPFSFKTFDEDPESWQQLEKQNNVAAQRRLDKSKRNGKD